MRSPQEFAADIDRAVAVYHDETGITPEQDDDESMRALESLLRSKGILDAIVFIQKNTSQFLDGWLDGVPEFKALWDKLPVKDDPRS